jgi:hypothetical protein
MTETGFELVLKQPAIAQGVYKGGEEKKGKKGPCEKHVGSCQHRRGGRGNGKKRKGEGKRRRDSGSAWLSTLPLCPCGAGDRVHPNLIRYTHHPRHNGELLALIRSMRNPLTTAAIYLGSKRSFSRRKTRETRRNPSRNSGYLQTSIQSSQKPKTEVLIIHAVTAERLFPGDIIQSLITGNGRSHRIPFKLKELEKLGPKMKGIGA